MATLATPDYPDFSQPTRAIAADFDLTPVAGVIGVGANYVGIDVSQVETVLVTFRPPAGAGGDRFLMRASWGGSAALAQDEYLYFHDSAAYSPVPRVLTWVLPCKGTTLGLFITSANLNTFQCLVAGTTRRLPGNRVNIQGQVSATIGSGTGRFLGALATVSIPAGATSAGIIVPPVGRAVLIHTNQNIPLMSLTVNALCTSLQAVTAQRLTIIRGDQLDNGGVAIPIPQSGLEISATNSDTVAHSTNISVWDVS